MSAEMEWPPRSPMKALLSSPSGRKKYQNLTSGSPEKLLGSPSLLDRLRAARDNRDHEILPNIQTAVEDEDEDEETLQLKLQAIEAKLKLKKLQQQKAKDAETGRPQSVQPSHAIVQVALSPTKRAVQSIPKSPSRVLLGIDKGLHAEDVSLKRARTIHGSPTRKSTHHVESRLHRPQNGSLLSTPSTVASKTFSERMAEMRDNTKERESMAAQKAKARVHKFKIDSSELQGYTSAANDRTAPDQRQSGTVTRLDQPPKPQGLKHSHSMPALRSDYPKPKAIDHSTTSPGTEQGDASLFEDFSRTHLSTRILPHSFLKRTLPSDTYTIFTIPRLLKEVSSATAYDMPDSVTNYVVFGIVCEKSSPKTHKPKATDSHSKSTTDWQKRWDDGTANRQKFLVLKLTDLKWTIDLFLFETAVPKYHRLAPGQLIAILNPAIMPPKRGQENKGVFSLAINDSDDQVLEIGTAKHLGHCTARKKDNSICGDWVDSSKTEICEYHVNAQLEKTRAKRSGINNMNGFGKEHEKSKLSKQGFDHFTQSRYYAVGGVAPKHDVEKRWTFAPTHNPNLSTAKLLDAAPGDDFIADGQMLERDKSERDRRRMELLQKEHEVARRLGQFKHNAGGQYMRQRTEGSERLEEIKNENAANIKTGILAGDSRKRAADSVRLGPVKKKTRFVTEQGIKVAGRESIGSKQVRALQQDSDDSDLDIV